MTDYQPENKNDSATRADISGSSGHDRENSYRSILKGTSIFGGVQMFQIIINLIRGKFVAMLLGPAGMGVSSLFATSAQTIQQLSGLGLNLAIVKEVAAANNDRQGLHHVIHTARRLVILTALAGALACILLSGTLSRITFGHDGYRWQFMLLSAMIFFGVAGQGYLSVLQGLHEVKRISRASIVGALTGLCAGVPLYYLFGTDGIVPAMVILALATFLFYYINVKRLTSSQERRLITQSRRPLIKRLLMLGLVLMASDLIGAGCNYLVNLFIRHYGALRDVGLFQAANSITNQYSGVVFTAMMLDFFPRLSAAASDNARVKEIVNRQLEIVALIATPLVCLLILSSPLVIRILLTGEFMPILPLMRWLGAGVLLKALMFPLGYITFAKDNRRLFFWLEGVAGNLLFLILSCLFYHTFGLIGLGYSLIADCSLCFIIYYVVNSRLYSYALSRQACRECLAATGLGAACFAASLLPHTALSWSVMSAITLLTIIRSLRTLRRLLRHKDA